MRLFVVILTAFMAFACGNQQRKKDETPTRGSVTILVDETFGPLFKGQAEVFESQYKYSELDISTLSEQEISQLLIRDTFRLAALPRDLTEAEYAWFDEKKIVPRVTGIGYDGVALIVNRDNPDSTITTAAIRAMLDGTDLSRALVFDHPGSGIVRLMKELTGTDSITRAYSVNSNREVIEYVISNRDAIGFIGSDWLYEADSSGRQYSDIVKVLAVGDDAAGYFKPSQNDIAEGNYPFTREIFFINVQGTAGLGMGVASFLAGDIGQRIVLKEGLVPATYPKREIIIRKKL